ncbi:MAG TPA: GspE/PulE family protein [Saprospiraceae bacterium]|nr:GspE/PulE family protein [Saprospiraceae bacterium]
MNVREESIILNAELQQLITAEQAWHYKIIPLSSDKKCVGFLLDESQPEVSIQIELEVLLGKSVTLKKEKKELVDIALSKYYRRSHVDGSKARRVSALQGDDNFLLNLILEARILGSSDIHVENYGERCRIRMRIDGQLIEKYVIPLIDYPGIINKIKIKANLDIAERRLPQDGRIMFNHGGSKFDIRVSILPTLYGEKVVLRILANDTSSLQLESLGFTELDLERFKEGIRQPNGIILISGPTGSGKTTTLYSVLKILNKEKTNVLTIEDPIEYTLEGINQVQLKESIGLTFASALRTFLRQDPDVIMLGEIRDAETAQMAIRAALTGHLVLSTIHTNSAWGTVGRLIDMGIPSYLIANTLKVTASQRLLRLLCMNCKIEKKFNIGQLPSTFKAPFHIEYEFAAVGCEHCFYTGYKGRKAIYEVVWIDPELNESIKSSDLKIADLLSKKGVRSLSENAFDLFAQGLTSIEEIYPILLNSQSN